MGRAFEYRRAAKEKRWAKMSRIFPKLGKAITVAAKAGGPNPDANAMLRMAIQNAKAENLPKENIDAAIKRATSKEDKDLQELLYEGYGPHGVAMMVECTTDNPVRTVANLRTYFSRSGGELGKNGSVDYLFTRRGVFRIDAAGRDLDELEFDLIDHGLEELMPEDEEIVLFTPFDAFGAMQKALESKGIPVKQAKLERFPLSTKELSPEQVADMEKLIDKLEDDDDVQEIYHAMG
jgi:YebC/PmpR family DNA-binding regulatory protein